MLRFDVLNGLVLLISTPLCSHSVARWRQLPRSSVTRWRLLYYHVAVVIEYRSLRCLYTTSKEPVGPVATSNAKTAFMRGMK